MSRCCCPSARLKCCVRIGLFYFAQILCHRGKGAFRYEVSQRSPPFPPFLRFPFGGGRNGRLRVSLQTRRPKSSARSLSTPGTAALIAVGSRFPERPKRPSHSTPPRGWQKSFEAEDFESSRRGNGMSSSRFRLGRRFPIGPATASS
jgi:hypothetical protein